MIFRDPTKNYVVTMGAAITLTLTMVIFVALYYTVTVLAP